MTSPDSRGGGPVSQDVGSRMVVVLDRRQRAAWAPPGIDHAAWSTATLEDTYETVAALELVRPALACAIGEHDRVAGVSWPGTPVLDVPGGDDVTQVGWILAQASELGVRQVAVVAGDAPDLPGLLIGKLFRGLGSAAVAVCPCDGGGLVAMAANLPLASWAAEAGVGLDSEHAVAALRAVAPRRRDLSVGPGWHRLRSAADLSRLDPGLEGWDATRLLLTG